MRLSPFFKPLLLVLFILPAAFDLSAQHSVIFPEPHLFRQENGEAFRCEDVLRFVVKDGENYDPDLHVIIDKFNTQFNAGNKLTFFNDTAQTDLIFLRNKSLLPEAYNLDIVNDQITIEAATNTGFMNGLRTLGQLIGNQQSAIVLAQTRISDQPAFSYRGVHLDCARHFFTLDEIKTFLDEIALLKFNKFHWHLTDDQGWRIEIKKYPKLTETGGWRDSTLIGHFSNTPQIYEKKRYGGSYTQEEAKEIVLYAAALGIDVIPEIEMPGHARAALAAYPELGCTGEKLPVEGLWGVFDDIFCSKPETRQFLKDVLDEVMTVFPSQVIHVGGDEAPKVRWDVCPHCAKVKSENGLHNSHELQSFFIQDIENHVRSNGRTIIGWDEILEGGLAENAQVMSWRGEEGGIEAAKQGHEVVMTPTAFCYFDYYQSGDPGEPLAIGGYLPLEKVYAFNPVPKEIPEENRHFILGGQANLWTEYLPEMKDVQYSAFPRLAAMAEVLWTGRTVAYPDFVNAMTQHYLPGLEARGVNFSRSFLYPVLEPLPNENGIVYTIVYPVKTSDPDSRSSEIPLIRTNEPQQKDFPVFIAKDAVNGKNIYRNYSFTTHSLLGIPVKFITEPNPKYNHHGNLALTDGITGARPWKGDQWLGFSNDTVQFIIDLGSYKAPGLMELGTLNDPGSWIYSPKKIIVEGSRDGKAFRKLGEQNTDRELIAFRLKSKARFLKITLINDELIPAGNSGAGNTPWTFIDELIFK